MKFSKFYSFLTLLSFITSCSSSYYKRPETIEEKMLRYETRGLSNNQIPSFSVLPKINFKSPGRKIAAVRPVAGLNYSNKRLYFLGLYSQYSALRSFVPKKQSQDLLICPSFHSGLINFNQTHNKSSRIDQSKLSSRDYLKHINDKNVLALYPELSLPLSEKELFPTAYDLINKKIKDKDEVNRIIGKAFQINLSKIHKELSELCETGLSSNYYIYENLITHVQTHGHLSKNKKGLEVLFKTGLFTNMALINSISGGKGQMRLSGRRPASISIKNNPLQSLYEKEVIRRLGVNWTKNYFMELEKRRSF